MDRTLVVSEVFPPQVGGSGRWFWEIYRRLPREQYVMAVGMHPLQEAFDRTHDVRLIRLPLSFFDRGITNAKGLIGYCRAVRRLHTLVRDQRISMLHCGRCLPEGLLALALHCRHRIPYACYVHGEDLGIARTSRELQLLTRLVLRSAEYLIVNSRNTERMVAKEWGVRADRIRLLYPGVDTRRFVPRARDLPTRNRLGWRDRTVVLTVARLQQRKGHDQMLLALNAIRRAVPDVLYAIAGDGEERGALCTLVERHGLQEHVLFMGEVDETDLVHCYQQCDLFVLPNRDVGHDFEGFGMVLLEAQACGKPVVAGASGGTAETMRVPETGRIVPCEGSGELTGVVIELLRDPDLRTRMADAARKWTVQRFDWATLTREAEILFRRCGAVGVSSEVLVPG